jgi:hypothetical protein
MRETNFAPILSAVLLIACNGGVEVPSSASASGASSTGAGTGSGGGGPSGPESFQRFSDDLPWCAVRASGKVVCWQPVSGLADAQPQGELTTVPGVDDATAVSVQFDSACARRASGKVACWGDNVDGDLLSLVPEGEVLTTATDLPGIDALAVSIANHSTCVIHDGGHVGCFDMGTLTDVPELSDAVQLSGGSCALRASGNVVCWSGFGTPAEVIAFIGDATQISVTSGGGCALHATGKVSCWKAGLPQSTLPIYGFSSVIRLKAGALEVCAIDEARDVSCWSWWGDPAAPADIHDAWDIGVDNNGLRCVISTTGALRCGSVTGM